MISYYKLIASVLMLCFTTTCVVAQETSDEIINTFFETYEKEPLKAVDYVFSTNEWMDRNKDAVENLKTQLSSYLKLVGDYYGYEKITEKSVGESYKLVSYMSKYERQPIRFTFVLYKGKDRWQVQNFKFDDKIDDELEESGKVQYLKENWN